MVTNVTMKAGPGTRKSCGSTTDRATPCPAVPDLSRYASGTSVYQGLVSGQWVGSTSVSLCDLVSLGTDESDPACGTENPRVGGSILPLAIPPTRLHTITSRWCLRTRRRDRQGGLI